MELDEEMAKKKTVLSDVVYYVVFGTRKQHKLLNKEDLDIIIADNEQYFTDNEVKVIDKDVVYDGAAVYLEMNIPSDVSVSNVVFNIKRNSFKSLFKQDRIKNKLAGEKSVWSRDFALSSKGKFTALGLYAQLPEVTVVKPEEKG